MDYGYIRVSSKEQNVDRQWYQMLQYGIDTKRIYVDRQSGKNFERREYKKMLRKLKKGDTLFVSSISRFGRNYREITEQWRMITKIKKADILVMDMPLLDTREKKDLLGTFIADIVLYILSYVAESERNNIRQAQAEGIQRAKARGVRFGRPIIMSIDIFGEKYNEYVSEGLSNREMIERLEMSSATFYNYRKRFLGK